MRQRLGLGNEPIVLTVSAKRPHKNLDRLFEAFLGIANEPGLRFVVPGYSTFHEPALRGASRGSGCRRADPVHGLARGRSPRRGSIARPRVSSSPLSRRASAFPCSRRSPAARRLPARTPHRCRKSPATLSYYFDPLDVGEMTRAIERLLTDEALREQFAPSWPGTGANVHMGGDRSGDTRELRPGAARLTDTPELCE